MDTRCPAPRPLPGGESVRSRHSSVTPKASKLSTTIASTISPSRTGPRYGPQTGGDNPERINNEAQFAALTDTAPVPASSGKTNRHRLSRGGDRQANSALHHVVLSRMQSDHRTKNYVSKRTADGKSKRETMRCLKRYVAREIFRRIFNPVAAPDITDLRTVRKQLGVTLQQAAEQLSQWPSKLSRIERGIARNDHVAERYRQWLAQQQLSPNM